MDIFYKYIHINKLKYNHIKMEMKPVLIIENSLNGLTMNESLSEMKKDKIILEGIFTEFDVKNRNERIYTKEKFLPHLNEMVERMQSLIVYGEWDHPDTFSVSLSRTSHVVNSITVNEEMNRVDGSIRLLNTHYGKEAQALVMDGCPIFVSSRAAGVTESNNVVNVKKLFTYDAVADPGFASTRMNVRVMNESMGFNESANFRIFDMSDESKFNEIIKMNKNDEQVTKAQMEEYSAYLNSEILKISEKMDNNIKTGANPEEFIKLSSYYEALQESNAKMTQYLDYLADTLQIVVEENKGLKEQNEKLTETVKNVINYSQYVGEKLESTINYGEHIAESLEKSVNFVEYIAENLDKNIKYSEHIAENLDKSIDYSEYLAENSEKISDYVDNSVKYAEHIAESLESSVKFAEYLAEHIDNNITYTEYVAENTAHNQAYGKYIAESLDKVMDVVNGQAINEDNGFGEQRIADMKVSNVDKYYDDEEEKQDFPPVSDQDLPEELSDIENGESDDFGQPTEQAQEVQTSELEQPVTQTEPVQPIEEVQPVQAQTQVQPESNLDILPGKTVTFNVDGKESTGEVVSYNTQDGFAIVKLADIEGAQAQEVQDVEGAQVQPEGQVQVQPQAQEVQVHESAIITCSDNIYEKEVSIKESITNLISEAKKRKASEQDQPHFLLFLNEENKTNWSNLSLEDKEKINVTMNKSNYSSEKEVLDIIKESLSSVKSKTDNEVLINAIPTDLVEVWNGLNESVKINILATSKFYPNLIKSDAKMESFWNSRGLEKYNDSPKKTLISESNRYVEDSKLADSQVEMYINKFKTLR